MTPKKLFAGKLTPRGFILYKFNDGNNTPCSLQQSSAYHEDTSLIWLGIEDVEPSKMHLARAESGRTFQDRSV